MELHHAVLVSLANSLLARLPHSEVPAVACQAGELDVLVVQGGQAGGDCGGADLQAAVATRIRGN